mmetsp:Transcript_29923/g.58720  ORF Transcript_29923/g.58720 Transcript_29923/m.58720 type:complete len:82 (+) Transcript_29923:998-1243(+)
MNLDICLVWPDCFIHSFFRSLKEGRLDSSCNPFSLSLTLSIKETQAKGCLPEEYGEREKLKTAQLSLSGLHALALRFLFRL